MKFYFRKTIIFEISSKNANLEFVRLLGMWHVTGRWEIDGDR